MREFKLQYYLVWIVGIILVIGSILTLILAGLPAEGKELLMPFLFTILSLLAAWGIGWRVAKIFAEDAYLFEEILTGYFALSIYVIVIGSFGILYPALAALPLFIFPLLLIGRFSRASFQKPLSRSENLLTVSETIFQFLIFIALLWKFQSVLGPPIGMDATTYHLNIPRQFLLSHSLRPLDEIGYYFYWQEFGMAIMPLLALDSTGISANMTGFIFLLSLVSACYCIVVNLASDTDSKKTLILSGLIASAAVATSPIVSIILFHTKDDLLSIAALMWGINSWLKADIRDLSLRKKYEYWGGLLIGAGLGVKPTLSLIALPFIAWRMLSRDSSLKTKFFILVSVGIIPSYWAVRNYLMVGHILAPNIAATMSAESSGILESANSILFAVQARAVHLAESFFEAKSLNIDGPIGVLIMTSVFAGMLFSDENKRRRAIMLSSAASIVLWFIGGHGQSRFLLPTFVLLSASGSLILARSRKLIAISIFAGFISFGAAVIATDRYMPSLMLHSGFFNMNRYIELTCNTYPYQLLINERTKSSAVIYSIGESRTFYTQRRIIFDGYWERGRAYDRAHASHSAKTLWKDLKRAGITHILLNEPTYNSAIKIGEREPPLCSRDTEIVREMLSNDSYCIMLKEERGEEWVGLYELRNE